MKTKFEKQDNSEMKLTINLDKEEFEKYKNLAFKKVQEIVEIDGFRKGNAPEDLIIKKYGEMIILEEMGQLAINETLYTAILKENDNKEIEDKILPISSPKINITKIGKGSDFEYIASFPIIPKIVLPDYKKAAKDSIRETEEELLKELKSKNEKATKDDLLSINENEIDEVLQSLRQLRLNNHNDTHKDEDGVIHNHNHDNNDNNETVEEIKEKIAKALPELNDDFAKSFGDKFNTIQDLRDQIKSNLELEKKEKLREKRRTKILESLTENIKINIPEILIEDELERIKAQMKMDIEKMNSNWEEYLSNIKKTEEDLKKEWRDIAVKRVKSQLIVNSIAKKENILISKDEIEAESIKILSQFPEAKEASVNSYVEQILINEKVLKLLEESK